jgi:hypothetical protein
MGTTTLPILTGAASDDDRWASYLNRVYGLPTSVKNIFRAQLATCCVAVTDPDGAADLPIFRKN